MIGESNAGAGQLRFWRFAWLVESAVNRAGLAEMQPSAGRDFGRGCLRDFLGRAPEVFGAYPRADFWGVFLDPPTAF
jgi:hypothetical protein